MADKIKRGPWLSGFLILVFIIAIGGTASYLFMWNRMAARFPVWSLYILATVSALRIFSVLAVWFWSRSGVVAYVVLSAVAIPVLLAVGLKLSIVGIGGAIILVAFVWNKWKYMSWSFSTTPKVSDKAQNV